MPTNSTTEISNILDFLTYLREYLSAELGKEIYNIGILREDHYWTRPLAAAIKDNAVTMGYTNLTIDMIFSMWLNPFDIVNFTDSLTVSLFIQWRADGTTAVCPSGKYVYPDRVVTQPVTIQIPPWGINDFA